MMDYRVFEAEQKALGTHELEISALWWEHLADCELDRLQWDQFAVRSVAEHRADTYRRTAKSLRIEKRTGVAVCVCCFKPYPYMTHRGSRS